MCGGFKDFSFMTMSGPVVATTRGECLVVSRFVDEGKLAWFA